MVNREQNPLQNTSSYPTISEVLEEIKRITDIGLPILAMSLVGYLKNMSLVVCMGKLGSLELAAGALAIGFTNITGYSVLSGLAMGMEPLCTQAFGSRNFSLLSITLQRTILMLLLFSLPISLLWLNLEPFMLCLHQNPNITRVASIYCRFAIPDLLANSLLHPLRIYLRSKGTTWPLMWCTLLAILLHLPIIILLTFKLHLGVAGIAISSFLANFNTLFFLLLYMYYTSVSQELSLALPLIKGAHHVGDATLNFIKEWAMLLKFSIQSCLAVCLEWWWYEFMTIMAGYLYNPRASLATAGIVIQTTSLLYTLPTALSASASTRVGNKLGAGQPERASLSTVVAIGLSLASSILGLLWTTIGRERWSRAFTDDREVVELTMVVLPIIGVCELANCPQTTSCGILRGSARPGVGAAINFCSFYMVGAPVAIVLAFVLGMGMVGLCYGLLAAQMACVVSILVVVYKTDWESESLKAKILVGKSHSMLSSHAEEEEEDQTLKCEEGVVFLNPQ
ncbi:protein DETOXIFICATION 55-like [Arachis stenosperma]|uniref:protein DETOXIFICATION 55-like n=1 Tax=Arachis stenosperma TaxID=217475 RepID=UPI0025AC02A6|nr:protein DETOXIFICATION 55-like [Arachis stenosperma]